MKMIPAILVIVTLTGFSALYFWYITKPPTIYPEVLYCEQAADCDTYCPDGATHTCMEKDAAKLQCDCVWGGFEPVELNKN